MLRGRYRLGERIGQGGMGAVHVAEDVQLGRRVAIKLVTGEPDPRTLERFRREGMAAAQLAHPHIAPVLEYFPADGDEPAMIVMELLEGESLGALLRRERVLPIARALDITAQIASALAAAHRAGIVHRDIKPENVFLVATAAAGDVIKVLDFGVAKLVGARGLTGTDKIVGTVEFMSPEQAMADADVGPPSDVFSTGVVLYRMVSGELPHEESTVRGILAGLYNGAFVPLASRAPGLPAGVHALVERCLAVDPARRFRDGAELQAAVDTLRGRGGPRIVDPDAPTRPELSGRAPVRRARWPLGVALAGVAASAATIGVVLTRGDEVPRGEPDAAVVVPTPPDATRDVADAPVADAAEVAEAPVDARPAAAPPRVVGIEVQATALQLDAGIGGGDYDRLVRAQEDHGTALVLALRRCYAGTAIDGPRQRDRVVLQVSADGAVERVTLERGWRDRLAAAPPPPVAACLEATFQRRLAAWTTRGRLEYQVRSSDGQARPLAR